MKSSKAGKQDYSKIIGQIDSLKNNITQLISVSQDTCRTVRISDSKKTKSPIVSRTKVSRTDKRSVNKNTSHSNISTKKTESSETTLPNKVWEKLIQVEKTNQQIKNSHLILEEMLRIEKQKRIHLQKQLKAVVQDKKSIGIQAAIDSNQQQHTPLKIGGQRRKQSKNREQADIQSFLLGDCDQYAFSSPKKRNLAQIQIMELLHKVSKGGPQESKHRLLEAVKRFIKK